MFLHLLLRVTDIVFIMVNVLFKNKDLGAFEALFGLSFVAMFSASSVLLLGYFYHSEEILEVVNNTLILHYEMSKFDGLPFRTCILRRL